MDQFRWMIDRDQYLYDVAVSKESVLAALRWLFAHLANSLKWCPPGVSVAGAGAAPLSEPPGVPLRHLDARPGLNTN